MIHALRFVQKDALKWVPINWTCYLHEHVFVKRNTATSRKESTAMMRDALCSFGEDKIPVWMVIFPEGTWVAGPGEQNLVDRSQAFAKKSNLPVYRNVLTPRTAGFCASVDGAAVSVAASEDSLAVLCEPAAASDSHCLQPCCHLLVLTYARVQMTSPLRTRATRPSSARKCRRPCSIFSMVRWPDPLPIRCSRFLPGRCLTAVANQAGGPRAAHRLYTSTCDGYPPKVRCTFLHSPLSHSLRHTPLKGRSLLRRRERGPPAFLRRRGVPPQIVRRKIRQALY